MSTIATKFENSFTKLQIGTAVCAVAAAAALPTVAAQAEPAAPTITAPITQILADPSLSPANLAQDFNWWWFTNPGSSNPAAAPTAAPPTVIFEFEPLLFVPALLRPIVGPILNSVRFELCVFGIGTKIGPYGKITVSRGC